VNQNQLHLDFVLNVEEFQKIQDDIAKATNFAILTVDYKGIPVTVHSRCSEFCSTVRKNERYAKLCEKCDSRGGIEAARIQEPYIYLCHFGLVDFAVPIIINNQYLGAVMAGQVILKKEDQDSVTIPIDQGVEDYEIESIINVQYKFIDLELENELSKLRKKLPVVTLEQVKSVANLMKHISDFVMREAMYKSLLENKERSVTGDELVGHVSIRSNSLKKASSLTITESITSNEAILGFETNNTLLKPGLEYIYDHYCEKLTLDDVAAICNISTSYFSRLFKRETGLSFPNFINELRVNKAKDLLIQTDLPIMSISNDLGFDECTYFIRVFKQSVNATPASYRKKFVHR
jgi:ligand-binding sensor protein/AraC-like DNA-binding protein